MLTRRGDNRGKAWLVKLSLRYAGEFYDVINRGNYRADAFPSDGAKYKRSSSDKLARFRGLKQIVIAHNIPFN